MAAGLTDEQLNMYEQGLKKQAEDAAQSKLQGVGPGYAQYGTPSMTNTVNSYNYERMNDYMNALAKREELAQTWQQTANQRALTGAQIGNMQNEHTRGIQNLGLQKQTQEQNLGLQNRTLGQQYQIHKENLAQTQKQFEEQKRQDRIHNLMAAQMNYHSTQMGKGRLKLDEWTNRTNALLSNMGLQINQDRLKYLAEHPEMERPKSKEEMLSWLSDILNTTENAQNATADRAAADRTSANSLELQKLQTRSRLAQLNSDHLDNIFNSLTSVALPLLLRK
jgi:hypothetical protein